MTKKILFIAIPIVVAVILFFAFGKKANETITVDSSPVILGTITNTVTATGTVEPIDQIDVGTQVSGVINKIYVDFNDEVKKGQLLAELDRSTLNAQVLQSKASLLSAENELQYREKNFERTQKLFQSQLVSDVDFEEAQYQYKNAKANVDQLRSKLEQAEVNLSYAYIYSPINGVILNRSVEEGQTVAASFSTPTLFSIARDLTKMQVEADVDEADIGQVKMGQRVNFMVDAFPQDTFTGNVTQIRLKPTTSSNVVTYTVIIEAPNNNLKLMPGLTANIEIIIKEAQDIPIIPPRALQFEPTPELTQILEIQPPINKPTNGKTTQVKEPENQPLQSKPENAKLVWIKKNNRIEPRLIETGLTDGSKVQVINGLNIGDSVVTGTTTTTLNTTKQKQSGSPFMPKPPQRKQNKPQDN